MKTFFLNLLTRLKEAGQEIVDAWYFRGKAVNLYDWIKRLGTVGRVIAVIGWTLYWVIPVLLFIVAPTTITIFAVMKSIESIRNLVFLVPVLFIDVILWWYVYNYIQTGKR